MCLQDLYDVICPGHSDFWSWCMKNESVHASIYITRRQHQPTWVIRATILNAQTTNLWKKQINIFILHIISHFFLLCFSPWCCFYRCILAGKSLSCGQLARWGWQAAQRGTPVSPWDGRGCCSHFQWMWRCPVARVSLVLSADPMNPYSFKYRWES